MKLLPAAMLCMGILGTVGTAWAQDQPSDGPGQPNLMQKPIDETFQQPIPPATEAPTVQDWGGLRPDYGREETYYFCSPCHSDARIRQTRKTREEWSATIDRILKQYPYEPLEAQEREVILDYLAKQYGPHVP